MKARLCANNYVWKRSPHLVQKFTEGFEIALMSTSVTAGSAPAQRVEDSTKFEDALSEGF